MLREFIALDVETANSWYGSICQIGLARSADGEIVNEWSYLIDPETYFDPFNVELHGISEDTVAGAPAISQLWPEIVEIIGDSVVAHHGPFDRASLGQAIDPPPSITWLDTARVIRRHWNDLSQRGYGLRPVCDRLGYKFQHHDALEDAKAAAFILNTVISESGEGLDWWLERAYKSTSVSSDVRREGNPDGTLAGETVLFTGALSIPRGQIADIAAEHGCNVASNMTKKVTLLVVGEQDATKLGGHEKSSKHRKAEEAITKGQQIQILGEEGFIAALHLG